MNCQLANHLRALCAALVMLIAWIGPVHAVDPTDTVMLVATPEFAHPFYGATVLIAFPIGNGEFLGFIVNKPTTVTLADAFPEHPASQKVKDRIFIGGLEGANLLYALVQSKTSLGTGALQVSPDLFIVLASEAVDQVIEQEPEHARFLVGSVFWQSGELESEIEGGAWYVEQPDAGLIMRQETGKLWEEQVQRVTSLRKAI